MEQILEIRETIIRYFKRYETAITFACKLILGIVVYSLINGIGLYMSAFSGLFKGALHLPMILMLGASFAVLPTSISYGFMILNIALQLSAYLEAAFISTCVMVLLFVFYARLDPRHNGLILAVILGSYFKIPYAVPLFAGLYLGASSFIPIVIGVFIYSYGPMVIGMAGGYEATGAGIFDRFMGFADVLKIFMEALKDNNDWIATGFVFTMVFFVVYIASRIPIDYSKEIALILGGALNIIFFLFLALTTSFSIAVVQMFFFTLLAVALVFIIKFFDIALDYQRAERVEFEDEDNYYYVKVIPKITINKKSHTLKRIDRNKIEEEARYSYDQEELDQEERAREEYYRRQRRRRDVYDDEEE